MAAPVPIVAVGLVSLVVIYVLLLALLDPDSIVMGSRWLNRTPHGRGGERPLEP